MSSIRILPTCLLAGLLACGGTRSPSGDTGGQTAVAATDAAPLANAPPVDPREAKLAVAVTKLLEEQHLKHRRIDDTLSRAAFVFYLERLDPGKMYLLKEDTTRLSASADRIDDQIHAGRLDLAREGAATFVGRLAVVEKLIAELLAKPLDSSNEEWIELDPEKLQFAATEDELRERWRQRLEAEILERVASMEDRQAALAKAAEKAKNGAGKDKDKPKPAGPDDDDDAGVPPLRADQIPPTPEGREAKARADLATAYQARFTRLARPDALGAAADLVNAITAAFDPHTTYLPPSDKANFDIAMTGSLEGIGAVLREDDHYIRVVEVVPGGASWRQGKLEQGDLIHTVQQQGKDPIDVADMRIDEVVKMIRGPRGTTVTLAIEKPSGEQMTISIVRDVIVIEDAYARGAVLKAKKAKQSIGYINLPSFYGGRGPGQRSAADDVRRLLASMTERKAAAVILDLRSNGGGLLGDAVEMTGLLVDQGPVVQTQVGDGGREVLADDDQGITYRGPVIVLVDRFSASASEIVAGALQDYQRALIVGTAPTHGKGTVQVLADLDRMLAQGADLGVLKLTVQQFFRVSGSSTQWKGVTPDILLPDPVGHLDTGERELKNSIPWSSIDAVPHGTWTPTWKLDGLTGKSATRVARSEVLAKIAARAELLRQRRADTRLPLQKSAWTALRNKQREALEATSPELDEGPPRFAVTPIDEHPAPAAPGPGGRTDDRATRWRENVSRDPWIEEALAIAADMTAPVGTAAK